jgi:hypothetical protein
VNRKWQKALGAAAVSLWIGSSLSGCAARPVPRPEAKDPMAISPELSDAVEQTAELVTGTGDAEAVVFGKIALIVLNTEQAQPGGTGGAPLIGGTRNPDFAGTSPGGGPQHKSGPGGSIGTPPAAMPGGGSSPGAAAPGGTPSYTHAIPNGAGGDAVPGGITGVPSPTASAGGSTPFDVMTRVANQIRSRHAGIDEVRFVVQPEDARRLVSIARGVGQASLAGEGRDRLSQIAANAVPAGTEFFSPHWPPLAEPNPGPRPGTRP